MSMQQVARRWSARGAAASLLMCGSVQLLGAQSADTTSRLEVYGFGQADLGHDFKRADPKWFDVVRPTKLPSGPDQFGRDNNTFVSTRQSRFGVKAVTPTKHGDVTAVFDFDMFGVGVDAGQTTIRLRHAYGQWGGFLAGQLESPFMDLDVFPNILDYWGPAGMIFFRNVLLDWRPIDHGETRLDFALERPGASADAGDFADRIELDNVLPRFPLPDFSAAWRIGGSWGHFKLAGIVRDIRWDQTPVTNIDISGHVTGWGVSGSSNIKFGADVLRLQLNYGEGIQNYFNDAPVDVGAVLNPGDPRRPLTGEALPIFGAMLYLDHFWTSRVTTAIGWSMTDIDNSEAQSANAFHAGQYASVNLLWTPVTNVMMGTEFQWARRENFRDDWTFDQYKLQFSFKYSFSKTFGGR